MSHGTGFRPKQTEALLSIYQGLLGTGSFRDKAAQVTEELARLARADWAGLRLPDPEGYGLRLYAAAGSESPNFNIPAVIPHGKGIVSRVFQSGQAITANDYAAHPNAIPEFVARGEKSVLCLPIKAEGRILGTVFIGTKKPGHFTDDRVRLMTEIVDALGPPLENARLRDERERAEESAYLRTEELGILLNVASIVTQPGSFQGKAARVTEELLHAADADSVTFRVPEDRAGGLRLIARSGIQEFGNRPLIQRSATGLSVAAFEAGQPLVANDYPSHPHADASAVAQGSRSMVSLPVKAGDTTLGVITVVSKEFNHFEPERVRFLTAIADGLGVLLENARLAQDLQASKQEMAAVDEVARIVTSTLDIDQLYQRFASEVHTVMDFRQAALAIVDESKDTMTVSYLTGPTSSFFQQGQSYPLEGTYSAYVVRTRETLNVGDLEVETRFQTAGQNVKDGLRSVIAVPLASQDKFIGTLLLWSERPNAYSSREQAILERLAAQIAPAVENSQLFQEVQRLALALESIGEAVAFVDRDWNYRFINQAFTTLFGFLPNELLGTPLSAVIPEDESSQALARDIRTKYLESGWRGEAKRVKKNGEVLDVFLTITPVRNDGGEFLGIIGVAQDITASKRAQQELNASEERYRLLVERARDGISCFNVDGAFTSVNPEIEAMLGWTKEELIGQHYDKIATPESSAVWTERVRLTLAGIRNPYLFETEAVHKDGHIVPMEVSTNLVRDSEGTIVGFMAIARDITVRKRAEEKIRASAHLSSIGELAAGIAHEINNPLTSVLGFSQLLLSADLPPAVTADLQVVHAEANRAAKIVHNLLSFARRDQPSKMYMDLNTLVERVLEMKSYDFQVSHIQVTRNLSAKLPHTMLDETQMTQVILNILNNAEQAMRRKRGGGNLTVHTSASAGRLKLEISDDGPGISQEDIGKLFEPFFTTKPAGEGTGLGLSITYGIVNQHDGDIWAESKLGDGATFHIELPVIGYEAEDLPPVAPEQVDGNANVVLVVDDEPMIRNLLARYLRSSGFSVDTAENGEQAWQKVQSRAYDCAIVDLNMPGMSGKELYEAMEDYNENLARRVVFLSGDTASKETLEFLAGQDNPFLSKPVDLDELLRTVIHSVKLGLDR